MVDFGQFGDQSNENVRVALIKCAQGSSKAQTAVTNAAGILYPKVVLFVGLCATMKPAKAKLGDVVISAKLATYDDKKVMADGRDLYRGIKVNVSKNMADLIRHADDGLKVEVHRDAVMLSGPELVDYRERREELLNSFPEALGLETEGKGISRNLPHHSPSIKP
jgi:nucleoside phosphorylase